MLDQPHTLLGCAVRPVRFRWRGSTRRVTAWRVWKGFALIGTVTEVPGGYSPSLKPTLVCSADTALTYLAALALEVPACPPRCSTPTSATTTPTSTPSSTATRSSSTSPT